MTTAPTRRYFPSYRVWKRLVILSILLLLTSTPLFVVDAKRPRNNKAQDGHDKNPFCHIKKLKRVWRRLQRRFIRGIRRVVKGVPPGGRGFGHVERRRQQQAPELFPKHGNVARLGKHKFPDKSSKYVWLIVFYSNDSQACQQVKPHVNWVASKASFKVASVDCQRNVQEARFCKKLGVGQDLPRFATVIDGKVHFLSDNDYLWDNNDYPFQWYTYMSAKALHDFVVEQIPKVQNINHASQINTRLFSSNKTAVLLLTDKYETSSLYLNLAYQYRLQFVFGESRAKNLNLAKEFGVKKYPLLMAILSTNTTVGQPWGEYSVVKYNGRNKGRNIQKWLDGVAKTAKEAKTATEESYSDIPVEIYKYAVGQKNQVTVQVASNHSSWNGASNE